MYINTSIYNVCMRTKVWDIRINMLGVEPATHVFFACAKPTAISEDPAGFRGWSCYCIATAHVRQIRRISSAAHFTKHVYLFRCIDFLYLLLFDWRSRRTLDADVLVDGFCFATCDGADAEIGLMKCVSKLTSKTYIVNYE